VNEGMEGGRQERREGGRVKGGRENRHPYFFRLGCAPASYYKQTKWQRRRTGRRRCQCRNWLCWLSRRQTAYTRRSEWSNSLL